MRTVEIARLGHEEGRADYFPIGDVDVCAADRLTAIRSRLGVDEAWSRLFLWSFAQGWDAAAANQPATRSEE